MIFFVFRDNETAEKPEAPVEEEPKELTLDEWKAQRAALRQKPNYNLRKAGEGEDLTQWKKMYALDKKKEGVEEGETDDELVSLYLQHSLFILYDGCCIIVIIYFTRNMMLLNILKELVAKNMF